MASNQQKADLDRLRQIRDLLAQAQALSDQLSAPARRQSGMETFRFCLRGAAEVIAERHAAEHVDVHGKLPWEEG